MAVDIKVAPDEKLELVQTYITDTNPNSDYFNVSELPDTFSGGKNAFLIAGSSKLLSNSEIKIQIRDANGKVCYVEYANGNPEYYEGNSKVVAVYVYPTITAFGPATITILGQLKDVPQEWNGLYSVKWERQININPALANTTRVRFYKRPAVEIKELLQPLYSIVSGSKVASLVTQSFASITVNQLETFAGDVARVKVFRTSAGDIADYELIQDISVESKNLLTTYELTGSVVGNGGIFGPDSLSKVWNTSSLNAVLNSTWVNDGLQLTGSGTLTYTSSLNLLSSNTYELQLDSFYTGSIETNLVAYVSGTQNGAIPITIFSGSTPTKNFGTTTTAFTIPNDEPTASLYLSQSAGINEWHVGNISLNLSQDTAFSPNEINFITSMPTVLGNETFNFKFEFYDINNNYVPVAVTQSALFTGGNNNVGGTLILISGSNSASLAAITALSQSVSGTIGIVTGSVSQSFFTASLYSASLQSSSLYYSSSASSSLSNVSQSVSGTISNVSQSVSTSLSLLSSSLSASQFSASNFQYSYSAYLNNNIFTDATGKLIKTPATSSTQNGLYTGQEYLGFYSGSSWKTYMANNGNFYLTSSVASGGFMAWDASAASLAIAGNITILGGDAATTASVATAAANAVQSGSNAATSVSNSLAPNIFTDSTGKIVRTPTNTASNYGLYLGSDHLGFYSASVWRTYMDNTGKFYLTGSATNYLKWDGSVLTIAGSINITGGTASDQITGAASSGSNALAYAIANNATASVAAVDAKVFTDSTGKLSKTPATGSQTGLFLGSNYLGYYNGSSWKTYMSNTGNFYLSGAGTNGLSWDGNTLSITGTIKVSDGSEVTSATITGAAAGATALQNGNTGKSLGLTGGSVGGVTIGSSKIYVGSGNYGNADTGFYVDSSGNMSLKDKLTWDGTTLSITGNVVITGGSTKTAIDNAATAASNAQTTADGKVSPSQVTNHIGGQNVTTIDGGKISALSFYGKTAQFDTGDIGGWSIGSAYLGKDVGAGSGYAFKIDSTSKRISITNNTTGVEKVRIDPSDSIPPLATSYTDTVTLSGNGAQLNIIDASIPYQYLSDNTSVYLTPTSGRSDNCSGPGYNGNNGAQVGVIGLVYPTEEIWVDTAEMTPNLFNNVINIGQFGDAGNNDGYDDYVYARYTLTLRVRKYANCSDAGADVNVIETYLRDIAYLQSYIVFQYGTVYTDNTQFTVNDAAIQVNSQNNYFRIDFLETTSTSLQTNVQQFQTTQVIVNRFNGDIKVRFGRVDNGYSIFSPAGLQVYQGVKSYLNASTPSAPGANFFEVKGKSAFLSGLYVSGTFSAESKQFQITHPLDEKKWLYHTSIEGPKAELIYRGVIELNNGIGSASIDNTSNMTVGTFNALTRNSQLFLQNNESFDRVKGKIESGSVYVISENNNSTASIDWTVIAERCDQSLLNTNSYNKGRYITERYKSEYADDLYLEMETTYSGSK